MFVSMELVLGPPVSVISYLFSGSQIPGSLGMVCHDVPAGGWQGSVVKYGDLPTRLVWVPSQLLSSEWVSQAKR